MFSDAVIWAKGVKEAWLARPPSPHGKACVPLALGCHLPFISDKQKGSLCSRRGVKLHDSDYVSSLFSFILCMSVISNYSGWPGDAALTPAAIAREAGSQTPPEAPPDPLFSPRS